MEASIALMAPKIASGVSDIRELLGKSVLLALQQADAFLAAPIDPADPEFSRKWAIKSSLIATVLNVQTKVDELELRREKNDNWDSLMRQVERVRADRDRLEKLPPLVEEDFLPPTS